MVEALAVEAERFGKSLERYSGDELNVRISTHERPKDADPTATVTVPGWTANRRANDPVHETLFNEGRNVVSFEYPEKESDVQLSKDEEVRAKQFPAEMRRKALCLIKTIDFAQMMDRQLDRPADIYAHSEGFAVAVIAATIRPQLFRDIIGYGPLGVAEKENWLRLLKGFAGQNSEHPDWGPGPTDLQELAHEYAEERRASLMEDWLREGHIGTFEEYFSAFAAATEARFREKKSEAKARGIEEFSAPSETEHVEAARRRTVSDSEFKQYLKSKPLRSFLEARELPGINLAQMLQKLSDEHGIGFAIAIGGDDSVMHKWRKHMSIIHDALSITKKKPRVREYREDGVLKTKSVFDPVVKVLVVPGGHQAVVGYPAITREVERALTRLNREHIRS